MSVVQDAIFVKHVIFKLHIQNFTFLYEFFFFLLLYILTLVNIIVISSTFKLQYFIGVGKKNLLKNLTLKKLQSYLNLTPNFGLIK